MSNYYLKIVFFQPPPKQVYDMRTLIIVDTFLMAQSNVDLGYYVISCQIVIQILWCHLIMCTVGCIIFEFTNKTFL